jgi:hypothetical protein
MGFSCLNGLRLAHGWAGDLVGLVVIFAHIQPDIATGGSSNTYQQQPFTTYSRFSIYTLFHLYPA